MSTPTLATSTRPPSRMRVFKRRVFEAALSVVPFNAKVRVARSVFPNLVRYLPHGRTVQIDDYAGRYRMELCTDFPMETMMIANNYEPITRRVVQRLVPHGGYCIDVGANVGGITLLMASNASNGGKVLAFEPAPATFARLRTNVELNPELERVVLPVQRGVAGESGEMSVIEDQLMVGNAVLGSGSGVTVAVTTVDDAFREFALPRVDFLKIDVEGMEYEVFRGAVETLGSWLPIIYYETLVNEQERPSFIRIESMLHSFGYQLFSVNRQGELAAATATAHSENTLAVQGAQVEQVRRLLRG